jgi:chemotaxis protein histidine kinase CheA
VRGPSIILITSFVAGSAVADPAGETIKGMDQCFALARSADAICGHPGNPASTRLDCLRKARDAEEECLEQVRSIMELRSQGRAADALTTQPKAEPQLQPSNATIEERPEKTSGADRSMAKSQAGSPMASPPPQADTQPNAESQPQATQAAAEGRAEKTPEVERPVAKLQVDGSAPSPPGPGDARPQPAAAPVDRMAKREIPGRASSGWIVGETVSPVDFSPLLVAQINSAGSNKPDAPSALVLRCRAGRTEMSLRTQGSWHAGRAGVVEVVFTDDRRPPQRSRWSVASDGKSASLAEDAISAVQGLLGATISISINDGAQDVGTATFELVGIDAVREKLARRCRWPAVTAQSRAR